MDLKEKWFLNSYDVSHNVYLLPSMTEIIGRYEGTLKLGKSQPGSWGPLNFRVLELSCITLHSKSLLSWYCSKSNSKFHGGTENQHNLQSLKGQGWLPGLIGALYFTWSPFHPPKNVPFHIPKSQNDATFITTSKRKRSLLCAFTRDNCIVITLLRAWGPSQNDRTELWLIK